MSAPAASPSPEATAGTCERCGADVAPYQEYCLDCGGRLAAAARSRDAVTSWRPGAPWLAGDSVWPVLVSLVVAVLVAAAAVAFRSDGEQRTEDAVLTFTLEQAAPPPTEQAPPTATAQVAAPPPPPAETRPPPARTAGGLQEWPAGRDGFTVVLASLPKASGRDAAVARARQARRAGIPAVGVLESDRFSSFHPGYYVVFSGVHPTQAAAEDAAGTAHDRGYADAYPKAVAG